MITLNEEPCAGRLGTKGVRSWFLFIRGGPRGPIGTGFLQGPWIDAGIGTKGASVGLSRGCWRLEWQADIGFGLIAWSLRVRTFSDVMRLAKAGPVEVAKAVEKALCTIDTKFGVDCHNLGVY